MPAEETPPLAGLKVVDFSWAVAGPMIGRTLADYGATVVKVESGRKVDTARLIGPYHDGRRDTENSALYDNCNLGKLGLALDMGHADAPAVARDLVTWADVVIESFSPGVMARWGLDYASLASLNPRIVMLSTSIMGQTGPQRSLAGAGNIGSAMSGFQHLTGWPGLPPFGPYGPYTDFVGPRFSLVLLLAALDHRRRTGEGAYLDISQAETAIHLLGAQLTAYFAEGIIAEPAGNADADWAPNGVYPCRRSQAGEPGWIALSVRDDESWRSLVAVVGRPEFNDPRFATAAARHALAAELDDLLGQWTSTATADGLEARLQAVGIPASVAASSRALLDDPQLAAYGHFVPVKHPESARAVIQRGPFYIDGVPPRLDRVAPSLGRDSRFVLCDLLGYSADRADELERSGALR
jgi:crotonobetainyl-CoA:carnitine CoA-transferase CaiB-like acyl-CoA transferase